MPEELYYDGLVRNEEMQHDQTLKYEDGAKYEVCVGAGGSRKSATEGSDIDTTL